MFSKIFSLVMKLLPMVPELVKAVASFIGVFKKDHDPSQIESVAQNEVEKLVSDNDAKKDAEWEIVRGKEDGS